MKLLNLTFEDCWPRASTWHTLPPAWARLRVRTCESETASGSSWHRKGLKQTNILYSYFLRVVQRLEWTLLEARKDLLVLTKPVFYWFVYYQLLKARKKVLLKKISLFVCNIVNCRCYIIIRHQILSLLILT